uniref:Rho-GAP domain-containing protein n=1 Tax=Nothoprocta perdicaria TaxID=30464 RepID=A0A8C6Z3K9_NOTPE
LLDLLHEEGPATEGIFRIAASEKARRELREALNSGEEVDLAKQPVHLLAAVLKDFLRNIPSKLLVADLRDKWLLALERPTQDERIVALKDANLLLLRRLLSLLHRVSESAESNKMHARNLAICVGPSMLSCQSDSVLPLDVQQARNDKVCTLAEAVVSLVQLAELRAAQMALEQEPLMSVQTQTLCGPVAPRGQGRGWQTSKLWRYVVVNNTVKRVMV